MLRSDLHRALMMDLVGRENLTHLKELNDLFASMDQDHSGSVTEEEARQVGAQSLPDGWSEALRGRLPPAEVDSLVSTLMGSRKTVTYSSFMAEMIAAKKVRMQIASL